MGTHGHSEGSITHWGLLRGTGERQQGAGSWGGITWGEMPDTGDGDGGSKPYCHVCTYAIILHVLHMYTRPKVQLKKKSQVWKWGEDNKFTVEKPGKHYFS